MGETEGFVKVLAHEKTDRILGVHIIGPRAADMIAESVLAVELGGSSEDIARTVHGPPDICRGPAGSRHGGSKMLHICFLSFQFRHFFYNF